MDKLASESLDIMQILMLVIVVYAMSYVHNAIHLVSALLACLPHKDQLMDSAHVRLAPTRVVVVA